jgi:hypothetical protein
VPSIYTKITTKTRAFAAASAHCALFLLVVPAVSILWAGREFPQKPGEQVVGGQILLKLAPGALPSTVISSIAPAASAVAQDRADLYLLQLPSGSISSAGNITSLLASHPLVVFAEPNRVRHSLVQAPTDSNYSSQWDLQTVRALLAWGVIPDRYLTSTTAGTNRITVAILDTGADCTHPDFKNLSGSSADSAAGGQLRFSLSQAPVPTTISSPTCSWQDDNGHGTHVAGTVAAATNNGVGVASLGYALQVVVYKVLDASGSGTDSVIASAIKSAADAGVNIISMSLGGAGFSQTLQDAVTYAWQRNVLVVCAAGNTGDGTLIFPAAANYALGVAATDSSNNRASFSTIGDAVDIAAPGVSILSTFPSYPAPLGTNYGYLSGTSMATPHVSALAGMTAMMNPAPNAAAIAQRLQQTASSTDPTGGWNQYTGYGIIDAYNAVTGTLRSASLGGIVGQVVDSSGAAVPGAQVTLGAQVVTANAGGLFRFGSLSPGTYSLNAGASGFSPQTISAVVAAGADTTTNIAMQVSYARFTGIVTDLGVPVAGVIVQALSGGLIKSTAVTDISGQYTLWVTAGTYNVRASSVARNNATVSNQQATAGSATPVNLSMSLLGNIRGTVSDAGGKPVANADISVSGGSVNLGTSTDSSGNYTTAGLPTGTYTVTATSGTSTASVSSIGVSPDNTTVANLQFTKGSIAIYNTGVSSAGSLLADGAVDPHYTLTSSADAGAPGPNLFVVNSSGFPFPYWLGNGPSSKWIAPLAYEGTGNAQGTYTYHTTFDLTGFNPATASLTGQWGADNSAVMKLNGVTVASVTGFASLTPFTISSGFVAGVNSLDFIVTNDPSTPNPTGLRVEISGSASAATGVSVTVNPTSATLTTSQTQSFTATVSGTATTSVTWSISPTGVGTLTPNGNSASYQAPSSIPSQQTLTITARSTADTSKTASATVTLNPPAPTAIAVYNTGVSSGGSLLADGAVDPHYTLTSSADAGAPGPNLFVVNSSGLPFPYWPGDGPSSKWIAPLANEATGNPEGTYTYHTTFNLTGFNPATASLTGQWGADNSAVMKLNGVTVTSVPGFSSLTPFTISSGFVAGVNSLDFVVTNLSPTPNPTGLRVEISGTVSP